MSDNEILGEYTAFLDKIFSELAKKNVNVSSYFIDHLCYRVPSYSRYEQMKQKLSLIGHLLTEELVNGRPIATYKLHKPLRYRDYLIPLIELPAPKVGRPYLEGLEHAEFVVEHSLDLLLSKYPNLAFDVGAMSQSINPELALQLCDDAAVKFHNQSLEDVIKLEISQRNLTSHRKKYRAVLFDLDGTICASGTAFDFLVQKVMSKYLNREITIDEVVAKHAAHYYPMFEKFGINDRNIVFGLIDQIGSLWNYKKNETPIYPGIETLFTMCRDLGLDIFVWTARDRVSVAHTLKTLEIEYYFKDVFAFDHETGGKPVPTRRQLEVLAPYENHILMVGDTEVDRAGAQKLNIDFFEARWRDAGQEHLVGQLFTKVFSYNVE